MANEREAYMALRLKQSEFRALKGETGFPAKTDDGYDVEAIREFIAKQTDDETDNTSEAGDDAESGDPADVGRAEQSEPRQTPPDDEQDPAAESGDTGSEDDEPPPPKRAPLPVEFVDSLTGQKGDEWMDPSQVEQPPKPPRKLQPPKQEEVPHDLFALSVPLTTETKPATSRSQLHLRLKPGKQRQGLARLTRGLIAYGAKLANGEPVGSSQDALRWMMEQLADAHPDS